MSDVPLETCWAFNEEWNNKFCYKVASCWLFPLNYTAMHGSMWFPIGINTSVDVICWSTCKLWLLCNETIPAVAPLTDDNHSQYVLVSYEPVPVNRQSMLQYVDTVSSNNFCGCFILFMPLLIWNQPMCKQKIPHEIKNKWPLKPSVFFFMWGVWRRWRAYWKHFKEVASGDPVITWKAHMEQCLASNGNDNFQSNCGFLKLVLLFNGHIFCYYYLWTE